MKSVNLIAGALSYACLPAILSATLLSAALSGQGTLQRGIYVDSMLGFQLKIPAKWKQVPTQVDERWIVAQFQSNQDYEGHVKLDGAYSVHKPMVRVIQFDEKAINAMKKVRTQKTGDNTTVRTLKLPYRDYKDYVKRNLRKGGFFFSSQEMGKKFGKYTVDKYEVKVEKLTRGGRRRFVAYVFKGEGIDFAVEFEFLEHKYKKLKKHATRSLNSFKLLPRIMDASQTSDVDDTFGKWLRLDWKKKSVDERHNLRRQTAAARAKKAIAGLPEGWKVSNSKHFTVLTHASKKYTSRLVKASETCRKWLEKRFGGINDEYVSKGIVRICRDDSEYSAYRTGSADAFSLDDREIATYEDKGAGNTGDHGTLFYALYNQFMADKDDLIYDRTPYWLSHGLELYFQAARVKGGKIDFKITDYEPEAFRTLRRKKITPMSVKKLMFITYKQYRKGNTDGHKVTYQLVTFLRFIESDAKKHKLLKSRKSDFILDYLRATVKASEEYEAKRKAGTLPTTEAETEEEEEKNAENKNDWYYKRRQTIGDAVNKTMCDWSEDQWKSIDKAYRSYLKKRKYL